MDFDFTEEQKHFRQEVSKINQACWRICANGLKLLAA